MSEHGHMPFDETTQHWAQSLLIGFQTLTWGFTGTEKEAELLTASPFWL